MAAPMKGIWSQRFGVAYSGSSVWGTGINPVHGFYGSPAARLDPIAPMEGLPQETHDITPPYEGVPGSTAQDYGYSYPGEASNNSTLEVDNRPAWDVVPQDSPARISTQGQPPYNATGAQKNRFRDTLGGAFTFWRGKLPRADYGQPSETVSEGWLNKPNFGPVARARPSDPSQYEIQTSMTQRFKTQDNRRAVMRTTDDPREPIASRVVPQRSPVYSGNARHYDMFPRQQSPDALAREFVYRTAGTGEPSMMQYNEMWQIDALERTPPPDPYIGTPDTAGSFGYTPEDYFYA